MVIEVQVSVHQRIISLRDMSHSSKAYKNAVSRMYFASAVSLHATATMNMVWKFPHCLCVYLINIFQLLGTCISVLWLGRRCLLKLYNFYE